MKPLMNFVPTSGQRHLSPGSSVSEANWNSSSLRTILHRDFRDQEILVVSNREPYSHIRNGGKIEVRFPASGLVTALEPVMRACSGTWIAHGSGNADRETVDASGHLLVPPGENLYLLRRLWLSPEEEKGYYLGLANEGLWALCHIAHVRPVFRSRDWSHYIAVNEKFADAVAEETTTTNPLVLVQDYHFALLPRMIRERLPRATVVSFWHIPFPNPEVFGICPWREEILRGLLGSNILGFHTRYHCNNFLDSVDRFLESRICREDSTVCHQGAVTEVKSYPISVEFPSKHSATEPPERCSRHIRRENRIPSDCKVGLGVDRLDYTKGILERFYSIERLFEIHPDWIGRFAFVQIAAPSRGEIEPYRNFASQVRSQANRINERFRRPGYEPIILREAHHPPEEVNIYYRGCDLCFVSSLHDGMNLVAKEFIAAREDEEGVLVLSQFTGASVELPEALIVNPYDIDQCAGALFSALSMSPAERRLRLQNMRAVIQEFNVYRWAGQILLDAASLRQRQRLQKPSHRLQPLRASV